jgi:hypothetical protein
MTVVSIGGYQLHIYYGQKWPPQLKKKKRKKTAIKRLDIQAGGMAVVDCLPGKCKALSSNHNTTTKKKKTQLSDKNPG